MWYTSLTLWLAREKPCLNFKMLFPPYCGGESSITKRLTMPVLRLVSTREQERSSCVSHGCMWNIQESKRESHGLSLYGVTAQLYATIALKSAVQPITNRVVRLHLSSCQIKWSLTQLFLMLVLLERRLLIAATVGITGQQDPNQLSRCCFSISKAAP